MKKFLQISAHDPLDIILWKVIEAESLKAAQKEVEWIHPQPLILDCDRLDELKKQLQK